MRLAALVAAALLAGCLTTPDDHPNHDPDTTQDPVTAWAFNLTTDHALTLDTAAPGLVPLGWSNQHWAQGTPPQTWQLAQNASMRVHKATAILTFQADPAALGSQYRSGEVTAWWGAGDSIIGHTTTATPTPMQGRFEASFELEVPKGGLITTPRHPMTLMVGTYALDDEHTAFISLATGPSRFIIEAEPIQVADWTDPHNGFRIGEIGGDCTTDGITQRVEHTIDIDPAWQQVELHLLPSSGYGIPDLDLYLRDANGEYPMRTHGPGPYEVMRLYDINLAHAPHPWTLEVLAVCAGLWSYEIHFGGT